MTAFGFYRLAGLALGVGGSLVLLFHVSRHRRRSLGGDQAAALFGAWWAPFRRARSRWRRSFAAGPIAAALGKPSLGGLAATARAVFGVHAPCWSSRPARWKGARASPSRFFGARSRPTRCASCCCRWSCLCSNCPTPSWPMCSRSRYCCRGCGWRGACGIARSRAGSAGRDGITIIAASSSAATLFANQLGAADIVIASVLFSVGDRRRLRGCGAARGAVHVLRAGAAQALRAPRRPFAADKGYGRPASRIRRVPAAGHRLRRADHRRRAAAAPILLPLLGNYLDARTLLIWLAIPSFVLSFYATSDRLLIIAGQANVALVVTASSFVVLVAGPFATAPWLGPVAIPAAMISCRCCCSIRWSPCVPGNWSGSRTIAFARLRF